MKWAWRDYRAARLLRDEKSMIEEAFRIRMLQEGVGVNLSTFQELGMTWPAFNDRETT
jgi:hypothetical protein